MSWNWRFLLIVILVRQLNWTCKFKESGLSRMAPSSFSSLVDTGLVAE
jgi:hypothetical protein